jgi:hypothetical protein
MNICKESDKYISLYIDDLLDDEDKEAFLKHIEECSDCAGKLKEAEYFNALCRDDQDIPLPDDFSASLHKRLLEEAKEESKLNYKSFFHNKKLIASLSTAAILVISVMAYSFLPKFGSSQDTASIAGIAESQTAGADSQYAKKSETQNNMSAETGSAKNGVALDTAAGTQAEKAKEAEEGEKLTSGASASREQDTQKSSLRVAKDSAAADAGSSENNEMNAKIAYSIASEPGYYSNYAELNLSVSTEGSEIIGDFRNFMKGIGLIEIKPITDSNQNKNSTKTSAQQEYVEYYMSKAQYSTLLNQAEKYNLKLSTKTDIITKDVTELYNNLKKRRSEIIGRIDNALLKSEDTTALEKEEIRINYEMKKIINGQDMVTVRIFFIL